MVLYIYGNPDCHAGQQALYHQHCLHQEVSEPLAYFYILMHSVVVTAPCLIGGFTEVGLSKNTVVGAANCWALGLLQWGVSPLGEASCENPVYEAPAAVLTANLAAEGAPDVLMLSTKTRALVLHEGSPCSPSSPGTVVPANCTNPLEIGLCPPVLTLWTWYFLERATINQHEQHKCLSNLYRGLAGGAAWHPGTLRDRAVVCLPLGWRMAIPGLFFYSELALTKTRFHAV